MYFSFMHKIFSDKEDGIIFECFGIWHLIYVLLIAAALTWSIIHLKNKSDEERRRFTNIFITVVFGLYVADFFLMPFAIEEIDIDKLPFHACTSMCVMGFWSNHNRFLEKFRTNFALLGAAANLMYIVYPSGVANYETHPLSYRASQTLIFHACMLIYGVLVIVYTKEDLKVKNCPKNLIVIVGLTLWAHMGNLLYGGEGEEYSRTFNWFFLEEDPFGLFSEEIAPYITPFMNIAAFFALDLIIYFIYEKVKAKMKKKSEEKAEEPTPVSA